jgi:hypothetical protein
LLAGDGPSAAEVTRQLGVEPDFAAEKEQVRSHGRRSITQRTGVSGRGGPELSPETLRRIADVGAILAFDFYGSFPENGAEE